MYKAVIFDLDGTLLNTLGDLAAAGNFALSQLGYAPHPVENYRYYVGNGIPKLVERIMPQGCAQAELKRAFDIFCAHYEANMYNLTAPYEGLVPLLKQLNADGIKTGCITNKKHDFSCAMNEHYFGLLISLTYGQKPDVPKKPDPTAELAMLNEFGIDKADALHVGDSNVDVQTAHNAGIACCGVLWGFRTRQELEEAGAEFIANDSRELERIIYG